MNELKVSTIINMNKKEFINKIKDYFELLEKTKKSLSKYSF